ncbi:MAG TPA: hypothetical protein VJY15_10375 [Candidatus Acidoferrum sp.]|nr:hypothetical protein [Candidatus Acidoferrum sp.]
MASTPSHEAPYMIQNMRYDYPGDAIAREAGALGLEVLAHKVETLARNTALSFRCTT